MTARERDRKMQMRDERKRNENKIAFSFEPLLNPKKKFPKFGKKELNASSLRKS